MHKLIVSKPKTKLSRLVWLRYIPAAFICIFFSAVLLYSPAKAGQGVSSGLELCLKTVIPSLFPFMFISSFTVSSGLHLKIGRLFKKPMAVIFRQPPAAAPIFLISLVGGIPVGTRMASQVYESGELTKQQSQRLCLFCINAGPAFVIGTVGGVMLGSYKAGVLMYISLSASSLVLGFLSRFLCDGKDLNTVDSSTFTPPSVFSSLTYAADSAARAMLSVCVWITVFACVNSLLELCPISESARTVLSSLSEVTTGCHDAAGVYPVPIIAGIIGWSGLSAHCQILSGIQKLQVDLRLFFTARVISGALSAIICQQLISFFPVETAVFASSAEITAVPFAVSAPVSAGLMLMCALLLLGENFNIQKKTKG